MSPQLTERERNLWQRKVGLLLTLIEGHGNVELMDRAVALVNASLATGHDDGSDRARVAKADAEAILNAAIVAGLVSLPPSTTKTKKSRRSKP